MKQKTKSLSSLKKRVKSSSTGKLMHKRSGSSHNNLCKSRRRKRRLNVPAVATEKVSKRLRTLVPYK
jgi:ribosomal protein L35